MSDRAKEIINLLKDGHLPPLDKPLSNDNASDSSLKINGLSTTNFGLQTVTENDHNDNTDIQ